MFSLYNLNFQLKFNNSILAKFTYLNGTLTIHE
jgi:hypothetical protein